MSRLTCASNPQEALTHATTASSLGDLAAPAIHAYILDHCKLDPSSSMGKDRLIAFSQLISMLDPVFAFNSKSCQNIQEAGLVKTLAGTNANITIQYLSYDLLIAKWKNYSTSELQDLIVCENFPCIICLENILFAASCKDCGYKVRILKNKIWMKL